MRRSALAALLAGTSLWPACTAQAHVEGRYELPGSLVDLRLRVDGRSAPLYPAPDGSGRYYLEARRGARYEIQVANRSGARLGVLLAVDGLNVVSGERERAAERAGTPPGRMYVLGPWEDVTVRGWRSSLDEVRQFTFVDEERSYAARADKANSKMGWIELAVYRERPRPWLTRPWLRDEERDAPDRRSSAEPPASPAPAPGAAAEAPAAKSAEGERGRTQGYSDAGAVAEPKTEGAGRNSYPGTGWGERQHDPVVTVQFDPEPYPAETLTLRYEYRPALVRLGVLPRWIPERDRLGERESGREGFARPPAW